MAASHRRWPAASGVHDTTGILLFRSYVARTLWAVYTRALTRPGRWLFWITLLLAFSGSLTLDAPFYLLFSYAAALWLIAFAVAALTHPRVEIRARHADRVSAGSRMPVELTVSSLGRIALHELTVAPRRLPLTMEVLPPDGVTIDRLGPGETRRARLELVCNRRGVYSLHGYRVQTSFPIGLLNAVAATQESERLIVFPAYEPLRHLAIPLGHRYHPGGVAMASTVGQAMEYAGNREFQEGDDVRTIDWRATARLGDLIVREYREEYFHRVAIILDTQIQKQGSAPDEALESALSLAAAISEYLARGEYLVDIFAAGDALYHLTAGRSLAYLDQILEILACVEGAACEPFQQIRPVLAEHLEKINTVFFIFLDWTESRQVLMEDSRLAGSAVRAWIVREGLCTQPPPADGAVEVLTPLRISEGLVEL